MNNNNKHYIGRESEMNNVINILERIGSNAALKDATPEQLQELLHTEIADSAVLSALQQQNVYLLESALNARTGLICGVLPAEEPQKQPEQEPEPAEEPEEKPEQSAILQSDKLQQVKAVG